jgi:hypothetical protein
MVRLGGERTCDARNPANNDTGPLVDSGTGGANDRGGSQSSHQDRHPYILVV